MTVIPTSVVKSSSSELTKLERIGVHSHITGLGLDPKTLEPLAQAQGMVGQHSARRAAGIVVKMVTGGNGNGMAGRSVLIAGPPGTGKTAIAMAMAQSLGEDVPFTVLSGAEVYSRGMSKTEALTQALRRSIAVRIRETVEIVEGEVVELVLERNSSTSQPSGPRGKMTIKTTDMETVFDLGERLVEALMRERVAAGDVVSIDRVNGRVNKLGRSYARARDYDAMGPEVRFVACPEGELIKKVDTVNVVSLHDIDVVNSRTQGFLALFSGDTGEIKPEVREQIDKRVQEWQGEGKADIIPGVLFIDEVHLLDIECFAYLNRALDHQNAPLLVMASNRGMSVIRGASGTDPSPHGLPHDLLDRSLIIATSPYSRQDIEGIIKLRGEEEQDGTSLSDTAITKLVDIACTHSLRYALQLITTAGLVAKRRRQSAVVETEDIDIAFELFVDEKRSVASVPEPMQMSKHNPEEQVNINGHQVPSTITSPNFVVQEIPNQADYVIVGAGPAGISAARAIRESDTQSSILLIGDEATPIANRPQLSKSLNQSSIDPVDLKKIANHYNGRVVEIEEQQDGSIQIILEDGRKVTSRKGVLIATGVQPNTRNYPVIPEAAQSRCMTLRSGADYSHMLECLKTAESVAIYGDGYVACELSTTIKQNYPNKTVHILNPKAAILSSLFPDYMSRYIQRQLKSAGIKYSQFKALKISATQNGVKLISTEGKEVECGLLIIDAPSEPTPITIRASDKQIIDMKHGVPCDSRMRVHGKIYTAGDVALPTTTNHRIEHYDNAVYSGRLAGLNMAGKSVGEYNSHATAFSGSFAGIRMTGLGQVDNALSTVGLWESFNGDTSKDGEAQYRRGAIIYYDDASRTIKGVLLVNLPEDRRQHARELLSTALPDEVSKLQQLLVSV